MRFCSVSLPQDEEETTGVVAASTSLFETQVLANICGENDRENEPSNVEGLLPRASIDCNGKLLALAVGDYVSVFHVNMGVQYSHGHPFKVGSVIRAVRWLPSSDCFAVVTDDLTLHVASARSMKTLFAARIVDDVSCASISMQAELFEDTCTIVVGDDSGRCCRLELPHWIEFVSGETNQAKIEKMFGNLDIDKARVHMGICSVNLEAATGDTLMLASKGGTTALWTNGADTVDLITDDGDACPFVAMQDVGMHQFQLTVSGELRVYDMNFTTVFRTQLARPGETITGMLCLEDACIDLNQQSIALVVSTPNGTQVQIRNLRDNECVYSTPCGPSSQLVDVPGCSSDRVLLYADCDKEGSQVGSDTACVRLRQITEAAPQSRLERLIGHGMFDEAEKFAQQFGLDMQLVYCARLRHGLDSVSGECDRATFNRFIEYMKVVKDNNLVGETCCTALHRCAVEEHILEMLTYVRTRAITDEQTLDQLSAFGYNLCTYRLVYGDHGADYSHDSSKWYTYACGGSWPVMLLECIKEGKMKEARLLWDRYNIAVMAWINSNLEDENETSLDRIRILFNTASSAIKYNVSVWRDALDLFEMNIVPQCLFIAPIEISRVMCDWLCGLAVGLEMQEPAEFPGNALHVATTMNRMMVRTTQLAVTPQRQTELAYSAALMSVQGVHGSESGTETVEKLRTDLTDILRLKTDYGLVMTYNEFLRHTPETICHKLLEKALVNPLQVKANIDRLVRPYMNEHDLKADHTLYGYIGIVSRSSQGAPTASNAWDEHCLLVADAISAVAVRCDAVGLIARGAVAPWSDKLRAAVDSVLADPRVIESTKKELHRVCHMAQLQLILKAHLIPVRYLNEWLAGGPRRAAGMFQTMFADSPKTSQEVIVDACKALTVMEQLGNGFDPCLVNEQMVHMIYCEHKMRQAEKEGPDGEGMHPVFRHLESLDAGLRGAVSSELIRSAIYRADSLVSMRHSQLALEKRLLALSLATSLIERFHHNDDEWTEQLSKLRVFEKLQTVFGEVLGSSVLRRPIKKMELLHAFLAKQDRQLDEAYRFASCLLISREDAMRAVLDMCIEAGNAAGICHVLGVLKSDMVSVPPELAETMVRACEFVFWEATEVAVRQDLVQMETLWNCLMKLSVRLPMLEKHCAHSLTLNETVLKMISFVELIVEVSDQCVDEEGGESGKGGAESEADSWMLAGPPIVGMTRRTGVHQPRDDGLIMQPVADVVTTFLPVAQSVCRPPNVNGVAVDEAELAEWHEGLCNRWEEVFQFLSLHGQSLLEMSARVLASTLSCHQNDNSRAMLGDSFLPVTRHIVEKVLQTHPCDIWLAVAVTGIHSVYNLSSLLKELRQWMQRKKPQTVLNFLRFAQVLSIRMGERSVRKMMEDTFLVTLWQKRLGKCGVNPQVARLPGAALEEFVRARVSPDIVHEYVRSGVGGADLDGLVLQFAQLLITAASACKDSDESSRLLMHASFALEFDQAPKDKFLEQMRTLLFSICPYNHAVVKFVIDRMESRADPGDDHEEFIKAAGTVMNALAEYGREESMDKAEYQWYMQRESRLGNAKKAQMSSFSLAGTGEHLTGFDASWSDTAGAGVNDDHSELYDRQDMMLAAMPVAARTCLPFHVFMFTDSSMIHKIAVPIIEKELSIYNIKMWQLLVRGVSWLAKQPRLNKHQMLSHAVSKKGEESAAKGEALSVEDHAAIEQLLFNSSNRDTVVNCVSMCFRKLPNGEAKIQFLNLAHDVAARWLEAETLDTPLTDEEREDLANQCHRLKSAVAKFRTELLLKSNGLFDEHTSQLVTQPDELIKMIYSKRVDWTDAKDKARKLSVVERIAATHSYSQPPIDLADIHFDLMHAWLPDGEAQSLAVDPNDTMGEGGLTGAGAMIASEVNDELYPLPFFDESITRIVCMIELLDSHKALMQLINRMNPKGKDKESVSWKTKIRAACILLRAFSPQQLDKIGINYENICTQLELYLYMRLMEISQFDMTLAQLQKSDRKLLARTMLKQAKRHSPELTHTVTCLVIDFGVEDRPLVEQLLGRLHNFRKKDAFAALLKFCRDKPELHSTKNLNVMWAKSFDWTVSELEKDETATREADAATASALRSALFFLLSCPSEGGRAFDTLKATVRSHQCPAVEHMLPVLANYAARGCALQLHDQDASRDMDMEWTRTSSV